MATTSYQQKKQRLIGEIRSQNDQSPVVLDKSTSNLFRSRHKEKKRRLSVRDLNSVLHLDADKGTVEVEGMTTYQALVDTTLPHGVMPAVVPQLKSITIGGAISGVGIESSSFKYGLVHETIEEMEVLLGDGEVVVCTPENEHRDLFFGLPNSYGTLGYVLKLKAKTVPVKPYVALSHTRYSDPDHYFEALKENCSKDFDFIDGSVFGSNELYITSGRFTDEAPYTSDYTFEHIYYRSIRTNATDYLTTHDYIWRWDTDWFWCSKNLFVQNPIIRRLVGKSRLNSTTYTKVMRWNDRWGLTRMGNRIMGVNKESVIQDVDIPIENAAEFLKFFQEEIRMSPIWICPVRAYRPDVTFGLYPMDPNILYINFGFWGSVRGREKRPPGHYNRKIETKVTELGGIKSLYSDAYFTSEEFWNIYDKRSFEKLKSRYDPTGRFVDLYQKCVLKD
ncbi:MAG: FAD-binding oxidoreductase [Gammaproteobacteria bacterium]|nr:FAD-binding oxidoreductase [Gammaproteobacteria bacterium]